MGGKGVMHIVAREHFGREEERRKEESSINNRNKVGLKGKE